MGITLFGYDQGVIGGLIKGERFLNTLGNPSTWLMSTTVTLFEIGALLGSLICGYFAEKFGRLKSIGIGCVVMFLGGMAQALSFDISLMMVGRVVAGVGVGFLMVTIPLYQCEVVDAEKRGAAQCLHWITNIAG